MRQARKLQALSRSQRCLLQSALLPPSAAIEVWRSWLCHHELDAVSAEEFWLLPQIYSNLSERLGDEDERARLRGVLKQMHLRNEIRRQQLRATLAALDGAGLRVIPGVQLTLFLRTQGRRIIPLSQPDLIVGSGALVDIDRVLRTMHWKPALPLPPERLAPFLHSVQYTHSRCGILTLRLRPFSLDCPVEIDRKLMQHLKRYTNDEMETCLVGPNSLLVMACLNSPLVEFVVVLNAIQHELDWNEVGAWAAGAGAIEALGAVLGTLPPAMAGCVPQALANGQIVALPDPVPGELQSLYALFLDLLWRYRNATGADSWRSGPGGFVALVFNYYHYVWASAWGAGSIAQSHAGSAGQFMERAIRKLSQRLKRSLGGRY